MINTQENYHTVGWRILKSLLKNDQHSSKLSHCGLENIEKSFEK
jgi:hypothetical protein